MAPEKVYNIPTISVYSDPNLCLDELDSFMYQTVGHDAIHFYADCMQLPLYRREITGTAISLGAQYEVTPKDETEDLYELLKEIKVRLYIRGIDERVKSLHVESFRKSTLKYKVFLLGLFCPVIKKCE